MGDGSCSRFSKECTVGGSGEASISMGGLDEELEASDVSPLSELDGYVG